MHTIRVTSYLGDMDDLREVNIIGPYPNEADRDEAIERLDALPDVRGNLDLEPSQMNPDGVDNRCSAEAVAHAQSMDDIAKALRLFA